MLAGLRCTDHAFGTLPCPSRCLMHDRGRRARDGRSRSAPGWSAPSRSRRGRGRAGRGLQGRHRRARGHAAPLPRREDVGARAARRRRGARDQQPARRHPGLRADHEPGGPQRRGPGEPAPHPGRGDARQAHRRVAAPLLARPRDEEKGPVDLAVVVDDALFLLQPQLKEGRLEIVRQLRAGGGARQRQPAPADRGQPGRQRDPGDGRRGDASPSARHRRGRARGAVGRRRRPGCPAGAREADLRAVLHHQAGRAGDRPRPLHLLPDRRGARRHHPPREPAGGRRAASSSTCRPNPSRDSEGSAMDETRDQARPRAHRRRRARAAQGARGDAAEEGARRGGARLAHRRHPAARARRTSTSPCSTSRCRSSPGSSCSTR